MNYFFIEMFCAITSKDVMLKISFGLIKRFQRPELHLTVEKIAQRFNQVTLNMVSWLLIGLQSSPCVNFSLKYQQHVWLDHFFRIATN